MEESIMHDAGGRPIVAVMADLRVFVSSIRRPRPSDASWTSSARLRGEELALRVAGLRESMTGRQSAYARCLEKISRTLGEYTDELSRRPSVKKLRSHYRALAVYYEEMSAHLKAMKLEAELLQAGAVPIKPVNYTRCAFHCLMGIFSVLTYVYVVTHNQALAILFIFMGAITLFEIVRRLAPIVNDAVMRRALSFIVRPVESYTLTGSTYYILGMMIIVLVFPPRACEVAVLVLAFADPAATVAGKLLGGRKILGEKSVAGAAAFFVVAFLVSMVFFALAQPWLLSIRGVLAALILAGSGTLAEMLGDSLDDNLTIPIAVAAAATFLLI
jgi:diacylglycerol kinase (CTP)